MTPITITEEQKDELLEMLKKLFPEYKRVSWDDQDLDIGSYYGWEVNQFRKSNHIFLSKMENAPFDDGIFVHWYEFSLRYLLPKFTDSLGDYYDVVTGENFVGHPIDYLYDCFKEKK